MQQPTQSELWHGTTILTVRKGGVVAIGGDGQVSIGQTIVKSNAKKVRRLPPHRQTRRRLGGGGGLGGEGKVSTGKPTVSPRPKKGPGPPKAAVSGVLGGAPADHVAFGE